MKRLLAALLLASLSTGALAQSAPPVAKFTPFTVDEAAAQELRLWLNEQPFKFAAPVLQWLAQREQQAALEAQKAAQPPPKPGGDFGKPVPGPPGG